MTREDSERIAGALQRRLDDVKASSALSSRVQESLKSSRRVARTESIVLGLVLLAALGIILAQVGRNDSGGVAVAPILQPSASSVTPTMTPASPPPPDNPGYVQFESQSGELHFEYPKEWVQSSSSASGGSFYTSEEAATQGQARDMKLAFTVDENVDNETLADIRSRVCKPREWIDTVLACETRTINGQTWVWNAVRYKQIEDVDRGYGVSIHTIAHGRVYMLSGTIFLAEDVTKSRIETLDNVLNSASIEQ